MLPIKQNFGMLLWPILLLSGCTQAMTATPLSEQPPVPSVSSAPMGSLTPAGSLAPAATQANQQVYVDPQGWYTIRIPAAWEASGSSFVGVDGFFETGYFPEKMYMPRVLDVCQWLANIEEKDTFSVSWMGTRPNSCQLISLPGASPATILQVTKNPSADWPQRFLFIRADTEHFGLIDNTFTWLRPVDEDAEPAFEHAPLRPEDTAFWQAAQPLPGGSSLTEYPLAQAQNADPGDVIFLDFIPAEALPNPGTPGYSYQSNSLERVNEAISADGYQLHPGSENYLYDLYQNGELALANLYRLPEIYRFTTPEGERLVFLAYTSIDPAKNFYAPGNAKTYLIQNNAITLWENKPMNAMFGEWKPIWAANQLLLLGLGEHTDVQVRNSQQDVIFSFATYFVTHIPMNTFQAWDDHWVLAVDNFVIQDGEIINQPLGFEEVFDWHLINGKPFYFFRKGPQVGLSYDGQFLQPYYHEIIHGYCCGLALNNPTFGENTVRFFGKREDTWYYVVVKID
jgi:hypothetical protein